MYDKDALLLQRDWQKAAIYFSSGDPTLLIKYETDVRKRNRQRFAMRKLPISELDITPDFIQPFVDELIEQSNVFIEIDNLKYLSEAEEKRKLIEKKIALLSQKREGNE